MFNPTESHFLEIESWLKEENKNGCFGFLCNLDTIERAFREGKLIVFLVNKRVVGFIVYTLDGFVVDIDIAEIKYSERKKGYGKQMVENFIESFKSSGVLAVKLFCESDIKAAWESMGFIESPKFPHDNRIWMHRIVGDSAPLLTEEDLGEVIQLWNKEPYLSNEDNYSWSWKVEYEGESNCLSKPIIFPSSYEWKIAWNNGVCTDEGTKVKRFRGGEIDFSGFVIIRELDRSKI